MNKPSNLYQKIITKLNRIPSGGTIKERVWVQKYLGSNKPTKCTRSEVMVEMARDIVETENPDLEEFTKLIDSLYKNATTFQEVDLAARLLGAAPTFRKQIDPQKLDYWLNFTHGWAENDVLTQNNFTDEELLDKWSVWKKLLIKFSKDKNVHKRRASLVLLTKPVRLSPDKKLSDLAFKNVNLLKGETDILITKAVSWILRALIKNHSKEVANYLAENRNLLPKIAVREVETKLLTGRKSKKIRK